MDAKELFQKAQKLFVEEKYKESIEAFTKAMEAGEKADITYLSRGVAFLKTKDHDKAIEDFSRAIDLNNKNSRAYYYRGLANMAREDFDKAILDFSKAVELKPDYGSAFFGRGMAYAEMGNDDEAARNIRTALTYSEASLQGFADTFGMFRTQFDKALALMRGKRTPPSITLTEKETETLKKWLEE